MLTLPCTRPSDRGAGSPSRDPVQVIQNRMRAAAKKSASISLTRTKISLLSSPRSSAFVKAAAVRRFVIPKWVIRWHWAMIAASNTGPLSGASSMLLASKREWQLCGIRIPSGWHDQGYAVRPSRCDRSRERHEFAFDPARSTVDQFVLQHPLRGNVAVSPLRRDCAAAGRMNGRRRSRHALRSSAMRRLRPACVAGRDGRPPSRRLETLARLAGVWA